MLTNLIEGMKIKCHPYWPQEEGASATMSPSGISVYNEKVTRSRSIVITELTLQRDDDSRTVYHMQFTSWPDQGVPKSLRDITETLAIIRAHREQSDQPIVVHCSAGIGRTGVVIGADIGVDKILAKQVLDVTDMLTQIRTDRGGMIQTYEQLELVYRIVARFTRRGTGLKSLSPAQLLESSEMRPRTRSSSSLGSPATSRQSQASRNSEHRQASGVRTESNAAASRASLTDKPVPNTQPPTPPASSAMTAQTTTPHTPPTALVPRGSDNGSVLKRSVRKAESLVATIGHDYIHPSQKSTEEGSDTQIPQWRVAQKEQSEAELDARAANLPTTRVQTRYFAKKEKDINKRNSAYDFAVRIEKDDTDISQLLGGTKSTSDDRHDIDPARLSDPADGTATVTPAPVDDDDLDNDNVFGFGEDAPTPEFNGFSSASPRSSVEYGFSPETSEVGDTPHAASPQQQQQAPSEPLDSASAADDVVVLSSPETTDAGAKNYMDREKDSEASKPSEKGFRRRRSSRRMSRSGSGRSNKSTTSDTSPAKNADPDVRKDVPVSPPSPSKAPMSRRKSVVKGGIARRKSRQSVFRRMSNAVIPGRRKSLASTPEVINTTGIDDDDEEDAAEIDPDDIVTDTDTMAFLEALEKSREGREKEQQERQQRLREEFAAKKAEEERKKQLEIEEIQRQQQAEREAQEQEKDKHVAASMARLEELTFDFTFG